MISFISIIINKDVGSGYVYVGMYVYMYVYNSYIIVGWRI